jgi:hypothetical protein
MRYTWELDQGGSECWEGCEKSIQSEHRLDELLAAGPEQKAT